MARRSGLMAKNGGVCSAKISARKWQPIEESVKTRRKQRKCRICHLGSQSAWLVWRENGSAKMARNGERKKKGIVAICNG